ncbi:hypothetical protein TIFTF001_030322 [Ficus carica]|uniref:Uncharacterized protein n=1 Tax=Ficus carica TaxID=3494 RepID=A0AA88DTC5_FICCA|nr:hypothetical protein TIFTF001_030322 [Ficus carica]
MASKLLPLRRLWRLSKLPPPSSFSSSSYTSCSDVLEASRSLVFSDIAQKPSYSVASRSFCSGPLSLDESSQGPAAIDYSSLLQEGEFHRLADSTIHDLQEKFEEYGDNVQVDGFDIDYGGWKVISINVPFALLRSSVCNILFGICYAVIERVGKKLSRKFCYDMNISKNMDVYGYVPWSIKFLWKPVQSATFPGELGRSGDPVRLNFECSRRGRLVSVQVSNVPVWLGGEYRRQDMCSNRQRVKCQAVDAECRVGSGRGNAVRANNTGPELVLPRVDSEERQYSGGGDRSIRFPGKRLCLVSYALVGYEQSLLELKKFISVRTKCVWFPVQFEPPSARCTVNPNGFTVNSVVPAISVVHACLPASFCSVSSLSASSPAAPMRSVAMFVDTLWFVQVLDKVSVVFEKCGFVVDCEYCYCDLKMWFVCGFGLRVSVVFEKCGWVFYIAFNVHLKSRLGDDVYNKSNIRPSAYMPWYLHMTPFIDMPQMNFEMPRKATGESYHWDHAKETVFLEKLDYYVACNSSRHPPLETLDSWAKEFNSAYGGVPAYGLTLQQKKDRMKKIYRGWKALQCRTGLGYDPVHKECNHLRYEGLRNKELYYNIFEKKRAAGASGYGSISMPDDSPAPVDLDTSQDNSSIGPMTGDDPTAGVGTGRCNNRRAGAAAGPSRSKGSSGKKKQRDETDEITFMTMQEIVSHYRGRSESGPSNSQSSRTDHMLMCMTTMTDMGIPPNQRAMMWQYFSANPTLQRTFHQLPEIDR